MLPAPTTMATSTPWSRTAVEAMARRVGAGQLLYGSDRPVVEPTRNGREAILSENAEWLAERCGVAA